MSAAPPTRAVFLESSRHYAALLAALAEQQGWQTEACATFPDLLQTVEATGAHVVVLSHAEIPPGTTLRRLVCATDGPLVVLTRRHFESKDALRVGATLTVKKPFDIERLTLAIDGVAGQRLMIRAAHWRPVS